MVSRRLSVNMGPESLWRERAREFRVFCAKLLAAPFLGTFAPVIAMILLFWIHVYPPRPLPRNSWL